MYKYLLFILLLSTINCKSHKNNKSNDLTDCITTATVKDFTGLDGCRFLIVIENGEKWMPAKMGDIEWTFKDGQKILLGYKELEPMASVCMAEQKMIEVTCIKLADDTGKPNIPECYRTKDPVSVDWMKKAIREHHAEKVIRYPFQDAFAYLFWTNQKSYIYDCQGFLICEVEGENLSQCRRTINAKDQGIIIWETLGGHD